MCRALLRKSLKPLEKSLADVVHDRFLVIDAFLRTIIDVGDRVHEPVVCEWSGVPKARQLRNQGCVDPLIDPKVVGIRVIDVDGEICFASASMRYVPYPSVLSSLTRARRCARSR